MKSRLKAWLDAPVSTWWCTIVWCVATALFVSFVRIFGGPSIIDAKESLYGTWAVAHGQLTCVYPPVTLSGFPPIPPLYFLLSGGIAAAFPIGRSVAFPSGATLGPHCDKAFTGMNLWSFRANASVATEWIGCVGWIALMIGVVLWLRASGRGRSGWEPATLVVLACLPPVWMCVQSYFHPQDLVAVGLCLSSMACARRSHWVGAGILIALAIVTQQFALLVALPLLVLAPANRRISYATSALFTGAVVAFPFLIVSGKNALRGITIGTGDNPAHGGTVVWELHLTGAGVVLFSRVLPILGSIVLSWWVSRKLGPAALEASTLMAVAALSLSLRLVFEENLFAYYFLALAVCLVLLDVTRGRVRGSLIAWLVAVALLFCFRPGIAFEEGVRWGGRIQTLVPLIALVPALLMILWRLLRGGASWNLLPWIGVSVCALVSWPGHNALLDPDHVRWFWQIVLVISGLMLAARPLILEIRLGEKSSTQTSQESVPSAV